MTRFLIYLVVLSVVISLLVFTGSYLNWFSVPSFISWTLSYFFVTTLIVYYVLTKPYGAMAFSQLYLLSMVMKLFTGCAFIFIVIYSDQAGAAGNALLFVVSYFLYTALEVIFLYRKTKS